MGDLGSIPGSGRLLGEGHGNPTPVFLPGESHGWRSLVGYIYIVHGVAESRTLLSDFTFTFMFLTEALILAKHHEKLDIGDLIPYFKSGNRGPIEKNIINFSSKLQEGPYKPFTFGNPDAIKLSEIPRKMNFHFFFFQTFFFPYMPICYDI